MHRLIYKQLATWQHKYNRKPLILMGVRQCGKTHSLLTFGEKSFARTHYINFENELEIHNLFDQNLDPKRIIEELSFYLKQPINIETDLVIFDEIQACPKALTSLKYFNENLPELAVACAGSLLGLQLTPASFPVGKVDMLHLRPLSFIEFLYAINETRLADVIINYSESQNIPSVAHTQLWEKLKWYFITGGLPEVVDVFRKQEALFTAFETVRQKQSELIYAYYADIAKHSGKVNALHIDRIWNSVPKQLAKLQDGNSTRFRFKDIIPGIDRYSRMASAIDWLHSAELVIQTPILNHIESPLMAYTEDSKFKLFLFDVGLLGAMSELAPKSIIDYDYGTYKGYFAENFVAQEILNSTNSSIYSWQKNRAEVEFIIQKDDKVIPIEVKSGWVTKAKSLDTYAAKYNPDYKIILSAKEAYIDNKTKTWHLPLYLTSWVC
jgi:predicted AAA+ superfamily ATPase